MNRLLKLVPLLLIAAFGCAKSSTPSASTAPETSTAATTAPSASAMSASCASLAKVSPLTDKGVKTASGGAVSLNADNDNGQFYFEPSCVEGSGTLSVTVKNVGDVEHNFSVTSLGISKDIEKGETVTVSVKLPASGTLPFFCKYHKTSGMQGAFIVR